MFTVCLVHTVCVCCLHLHVCICICVSCPTGPGCDLGFHLLGLRCLWPTAICTRPTTQQMSPDTDSQTVICTPSLTHSLSVSYSIYTYVHTDSQHVSTFSMKCHSQIHINTFILHTRRNQLRRASVLPHTV